MAQQEWIRLSFLFVEVAAFILFGLGLWESRKKGWPSLLEFFMIFVYGILLEELDMHIFKTYHYGADFRLVLDRVPLCIAWLWAVILASSMAISDKTGIPVALRPFLDGLLAVWIDLSIDGIAIRIGYWHWVIPLHEGWFGVPAGNLYAWMWVAFFFSLFARLIRFLLTKNRVWGLGYLGIPFLAYLGLFFAMLSLGAVGRLSGFVTQRERLVLFGIQFLFFILIVLWGLKKRVPQREPLASLWFWSRVAVHLYFLLAFFIFGVFRNVPILGGISAVILAGEFLLHRRFERPPKFGRMLGVLLFLWIFSSVNALAFQDSQDPQDWYERAKGDFEVAQLTYEKTAYAEQVCFLSHQAVEKALKGALFEQGLQPEWIHETEKLLHELLRFRPELGVLSEDCAWLDQLYVPSRYPKVGFVWSKDKALECLERAGLILENVGIKTEVLTPADS
jgi:HEPN domain-containing protein